MGEGTWDHLPDAEIDEPLAPDIKPHKQTEENLSDRSAEINQRLPSNPACLDLKASKAQSRNC
jgi:hypothetical protein